MTPAGITSMVSFADINSGQDVTVTNDGATILSLLDGTIAPGKDISKNIALIQCLLSRYRVGGALGVQVSILTTLKFQRHPDVVVAHCNRLIPD